MKLLSNLLHDLNVKKNVKKDEKFIREYEGKGANYQRGFLLLMNEEYINVLRRIVINYNFLEKIKKTA